MAAPNFRFVKNLNNPSLVGPLVLPGLFQAGSSQAITAGTILEKTAGGNTQWVPIDSDHDATSTKLAIAGTDIASGDLAGYYPIIVPRPSDLFEFDIATAAGTVAGTALYYSSATELAASGSNIIAYSAVGPHYPALQNRLSQGQLGDNGTTIRTSAKVWAAFREAVSYYSAIQGA